MYVLIAPDSFKGSLPAATAAAAIAAGWHSVRPGDKIEQFPQADGGEGTLAALATTVFEVGPVTGPDGRATPGRWGVLPDGRALVELADSSGLPLMARPDPRHATTRGLGEVIGAALDAGADDLVVALGGSASTDGGAGALQALGVRLLDADGTDLAPGGAALLGLARIETDRLRRPRRLTLLTDVTAPLLGPRGAAAVFGPQKGADATDIAVLEAGLTRFADLLGDPGTTPGSGAAGGTAFGLSRLLGGRIEPGAAFVARAGGLLDRIPACDVLITGEGRYDATSGTGKVVGHLMELAGAHRRMIIAGQADVEPGAGDLLTLTELAGSVGAALAEPERWLELAGARAAHLVGPA